VGGLNFGAVGGEMMFGAGECARGVERSGEDSACRCAHLWGFCGTILNSVDKVTA